MRKGGKARLLSRQAQHARLMEQSWSVNDHEDETDVSAIVLTVSDERGWASYDSKMRLAY